MIKNKRRWTDNVLPMQYFKKKCNHCGRYVNFYYKKKRLCPNCNHYVYYYEKEEFKDKLKGLIKL